MRQATTRWVLALGTILIVLAALAPVSAGTPASADEHGLSFPAPAGTRWEIVGGYNTASHSYTDPHAIDVVRTDAPAGGTPALSPWDGEVTWFDHACLTVRNGNFAVLICHLFPDPGLQRGQLVARGQQIGVVAPPFYTENNGLAHLHLAVHNTFGAGQIQGTVPFVGRFALEGRELGDTSEPNAHLGVTFTARTRLGNGDPDFLFPGWNLIAWPTDADLEAALQPIQGSVRTVFAFSSEAQSFQSYSPLLPAAFNDLEAVERGDGVWLYISDQRGVLWDRPTVQEERTLSLERGFNLVTWTGSNKSVEEAIAGIDNAVVAIYAFDARKQRYVTYLSGPLADASDLRRLTPGQAVWVQVVTDVEWVQA